MLHVFLSPAFEIQCVFYTHSPSQFELTSFQVLTNHVVGGGGYLTGQCRCSPAADGKEYPEFYHSPFLRRAGGGGGRQHQPCPTEQYQGRSREGGEGVWRRQCLSIQWTLNIQPQQKHRE